jgi:hypothetical protein
MNNEWTCPVRPEEIPQQYNWVAQDYDGVWWAYTNKPYINENKKEWFEYGREIGPRHTKKNKNWKESLMWIPR